MRQGLCKIFCWPILNTPSMLIAWGPCKGGRFPDPSRHSRIRISSGKIRNPHLQEFLHKFMFKNHHLRTRTIYRNVTFQLEGTYHVPAYSAKRGNSNSLVYSSQHWKVDIDHSCTEAFCSFTSKVKSKGLGASPQPKWPKSNTVSSELRSLRPSPTYLWC